jgi:hypothetical protein
MVNDYLRLWLQSLLPHARAVDGPGWDEVLPGLGQQLASVALEGTPFGQGAADTALATNLEHLVRELASGDLQQVAEVLKRVHAARTPSTPGNGSALGAAAHLATAAESGAAEADRDDGSAYDQARRHLLEHEEEDRRRAWLTDRILDQMRTPPPPSTGASTRGASSSPLQSEVRLSCPVNGRAGGRFRIANATGFDLDVELRPGPIRGTPPGWDRRLPIHFDEAEGKLNSGQERIVKIAVDTAGCPLAPGAELELAVDVLGGGRLLHKVWVSIQVTSEV